MDKSKNTSFFSVLSAVRLSFYLLVASMAEILQVQEGRFLPVILVWELVASLVVGVLNCIAFLFPDLNASISLLLSLGPCLSKWWSIVLTPSCTKMTFLRNWRAFPILAACKEWDKPPWGKQQLKRCYEEYKALKTKLAREWVASERDGNYCYCLPFTLHKVVFEIWTTASVLLAENWIYLWVLQKMSNTHFCPEEAMHLEE